MTLRFLLFTLFLALPVVPARAATLPLLPHVAVYDLTLDRAGQGSSVTELRGTLATEWTRSCEGYILTQRMVTRLVDEQGHEVLHDYHVSTWESMDGTRFRFQVRSQLNGNVVETFTGSATLDAPGAAGKAVYTQPDDHTIALPAGTVFPTEHAALVLQAAEQGVNTANVTVFDGSDADGLYDTFAVIGKARAADAENITAYAPLRDAAVWHVRLAYFPQIKSPDASEGVPEFEVGVDLFNNAVSGNMTLDYGEFSVNGTLRHFEALTQPDC